MITEMEVELTDVQLISKFLNEVMYMVENPRYQKNAAASIIDKALGYTWGRYDSPDHGGNNPYIGPSYHFADYCLWNWIVNSSCDKYNPFPKELRTLWQEFETLGLWAI